MVEAATTAITGMGSDVTTLGTAALAVVALVAVFGLAKALLKSSR